MKELDFSNQVGKKITITEKSKSRTFYVYVADITHITCNEYVSTVHLADGTKCEEARKLTHFAKDLKKYDFRRANHHTLINAKHLSISQTISGKRHIQVHNTDIVVSKRNVHLFKER